MDIKPIRTKADYRAALKNIGSLMTSEPRTPGGDQLGALVSLVQTHERDHFPMGFSDGLIKRSAHKFPKQSG